MAKKKTSVSQQSVQSKLIMIFILVLAMSGLQDLVAEIMPELEIGPIEVGISTFFFVPLALCIIFDNWWACLAAPIGELVFSDLLLGEFGGLGEFEEVILVTIALFIAGMIVKDPKNRRQIIIAGIAAYGLSELAATFIDIFKVWVGVEELEAVAGLPESIVVLEFIDFGIEFIVSGILFGVLPALWLTPRLHGKIEPLMGIKPRTPEDRQEGKGRSLLVVCLVGFVVAGLIAVVSELGFNIVEWEPEFLDTVGEWFIYVAIAVAAIVAAIVLYVRSQRAKNDTLQELEPTDSIV